MRRIISFLLLTLIAFTAVAEAQVRVAAPRYLGNRTTDPTVCTNAVGTLYYNTVLSMFEYCSAPNVFTPLTGTGTNTYTGTQTINPTVNTSALIASGYSLTGANAQSLFDLNGTWNTSANVDLISANVVNSASGASSNLMNLKVGGVAQFRVAVTGAVTATSTVAAASLLISSSGNPLTWSGRSRIYYNADGNLQLSNQAVTDFGLLQFGGTTASFPALKRSAATLQARLADDSAFANFTALGFITPTSDAFLTNGALNLATSAQVRWNSSATGTGAAADVGLVRSAAGVLRVSDGTTGLGNLTANLVTANFISTSGQNFSRTITTAGTTGAVTINNPNGKVNFAAGATSLVVTNSQTTVNSTVIAVANTNDATCSVKNVVPAAGSFTINMTSTCTAETATSFWVFN